MDTEDRYQRGWERLKEVDGEAGERVIDSLKDIAPDFARYLIEFPYGDIYSRPALDLKSREIAVVAALTALGKAAPIESPHSGCAKCRLHPAGSRRSHHADGGLRGISRCS
jgi:alkylhydroperoxidase/carboxymuconolactone decarboxylase family protein YurZ